MKIIILDIETTGLVPKGLEYENHYMQFPYILSMSWKCIKDDQESETYEFIINQEGRQVPPEATRINGITQEMCDASKFDTFSTLLQFMMDSDQSDFIVGHNIYFDTSIIKANVLRIIAGNKGTTIEMFNKMTDLLHKDKRIDTMRICAKHFGGKWPTLGEAYQKLLGVPMNNSHNAQADVNACYAIYRELVKRGLVPSEPKPVVVVEEEE